MIDLKLTNGVYELSLSNPPNNEIGTVMLAELEKVLKSIDTKKASALILYSKLESGFSAGADLRELHKEIQKQPASKHNEGMSKFLNRIHDVMNQLDQIPLATIGVIQGVCFGGGFELALTCDIRVAEPTARFCFPELRLGIIPCFGGIPRLKRDVGNALVRDLLLTGRSINAKKALESGLVSQMVGEGEGLNIARRMGEQMTKFDSGARIQTKKFMKPFLKEELENEKKIALELFSKPVIQKALKKFVESKEIQPYLP